MIDYERKERNGANRNMINYNDIPTNITINRLGKLIKTELISPYMGKVMPNDVKETIKKIFTEDKFRDKIYKRPLKEGEPISSTWSAALTQILGRERVNIIVQILNTK